MSMLFKRIKDWATSITAFRTGDVIPVDGPSGTAKMSKDDLLKETAEYANDFVGGMPFVLSDFHANTSNAYFTLIPLSEGDVIDYRIDGDITGMTISTYLVDNAVVGANGREITAASNTTNSVTITASDVTNGYKYLLIYFNNVPTEGDVKIYVKKNSYVGKAEYDAGIASLDRKVALPYIYDDFHAKRAKAFFTEINLVEGNEIFYRIDGDITGMTISSYLVDEPRIGASGRAVTYADNTTHSAKVTSSDVTNGYKYLLIYFNNVPTETDLKIYVKKQDYVEQEYYTNTTEINDGNIYYPTNVDNDDAVVGQPLVPHYGSFTDWPTYKVKVKQGNVLHSDEIRLGANQSSDVIIIFVDNSGVVTQIETLAESASYYLGAVNIVCDSDGFAIFTARKNQGYEISVTTNINNAVSNLIKDEKESSNYEEYPIGGYENFQVDVDCGLLDTTDTTTSAQTARDVKKDRGILILPTNYSPNGKPVRLIIASYGTGGHILASTTPSNLNDLNFAPLLPLCLAEGYAVLEMNGTPGDTNTSGYGSNGGPKSLRSIIAGYNYVVNKYNIAKNGVFTTGYSQGSLCSLQVAMLSGIPVLASLMYGPDLDMWKIEYTVKSSTIKEKMYDMFAFDEKAPNEIVQTLFPAMTGTIARPTTFSSANVTPTDDEKAFILNNIDKWIAYNPMTSRVNGDASSFYSIWTTPATADASEEALYDDAVLMPKAPILLFVASNDSVTPLKFAKPFKKMVERGGCICELREYPSGGHSYPSSSDSVSVATRYGGTISTKANSWEGILFLERFDV